VLGDVGLAKTGAAAICPTVRGRSRNASKHKSREVSARARKSTDKDEGDVLAAAASSMMATF
jgi:hypothetical protein